SASVNDIDTRLDRGKVASGRPAGRGANTSGCSGGISVFTGVGVGSGETGSRSVTNGLAWGAVAGFFFREKSATKPPWVSRSAGDPRALRRSKGIDPNGPLTARNERCVRDSLRSIIPCITLSVVDEGNSASR